MASRTYPPGTDSSPVVDIEDFVVESSVEGTDRGRPHHLCGTGNGMWGGSQEVKVYTKCRLRRTRVGLPSLDVLIRSATIAAS